MPRPPACRRRGPWLWCRRQLRALVEEFVACSGRSIAEACCSCSAVSVAIGTPDACPEALCSRAVAWPGVTHLAALAVMGTVEGVGRAASGPVRSRAFLSVPGGLVALGPMTARSTHPVRTMVVYSACGGAGPTTAAVPLAVLTQPGHPRGHSVLVDFDSGSFEVSGQPRYKPRRRTAAHRSPAGTDFGGS